MHITDVRPLPKCRGTETGGHSLRFLSFADPSAVVTVVGACEVCGAIRQAELSSGGTPFALDDMSSEDILRRIMGKPGTD